MLEGLNVLGIWTPDPRWIFAYPVIGWVQFGKHIGKSEKDRYTDVIRECGGELRLYAVGRSPTENASPDAALIGGGRFLAEVRCSGCEFSLFLDKRDWAEGVFEWARIAFGMALAQLSGDKDCPNFSVWHRVNVCLPEPESVSLALREKVLDKYVQTHVWGVWRDFGIMVGLLDLAEVKSLKLLLLNAATILNEMEDLFQRNIKQAAQLASSASEGFHPRTRRPR